MQVIFKPNLLVIAPETDAERKAGLLARAGPAHRTLMVEARRAKFSQHEPAREALLVTGDLIDP